MNACNTPGRALLLGGLLLSAVAFAETPPPSPSAEGYDWQQHWQQMQQLRQEMLTAKTPAERQKLMAEHWDEMQGGMAMLGGCPMGGGGMGGPGMHMGMGGGMGPGMGSGMGPGMMAGAATPEQLDWQIQRMEQMLEQLKAHRAAMQP